MRNIDRIKTYNSESMAHLLVHEKSGPDYDYNYEEELEYVGDTEFYATPDGEKFYDYESAVGHTIEWLLSDEDLEEEEQC